MSERRKPATGANSKPGVPTETKVQPMRVKTPEVDMLVGREHLKQKKGRWPDLLVEREQGKIKKAQRPRDESPSGACFFLTTFLTTILTTIGVFTGLSQFTKSPKSPAITGFLMISIHPDFPIVYNSNPVTLTKILPEIIRFPVLFYANCMRAPFWMFFLATKLQPLTILQCGQNHYI